MAASCKMAARRSPARRGEFVLYDTTRPYELRFEAEFSQTIFRVPCALLQQRIGSVVRSLSQDKITGLLSVSRHLRGGM
jgi:hypothetical protein